VSTVSTPPAIDAWIVCLAVFERGERRTRRVHRRIKINLIQRLFQEALAKRFWGNPKARDRHRFREFWLGRRGKEAWNS